MSGTDSAHHGFAIALARKATRTVWGERRLTSFNNWAPSMPGMRISVTMTSQGHLAMLQRLDPAAGELHCPFVLHGAQTTLQATEDHRFVVDHQQMFGHLLCRLRRFVSGSTGAE